MRRLRLIGIPWWKCGAKLDEHGQPVVTRFNHRRNVEKAADELIGICRALLADGVVDDSEAELVRSWIRDRPDVANEWPIRQVAARVQLIYADGKITDEERKEFAELLSLLVGAQPESTAGATRLPVDEPAPPITFSNNTFVVTGKFIYGTREKVIASIMERGGAVLQNVTLATRFLLIGALASRDWAHASYGRKIEKAVECRDRGAQLAIVSEEHWVTFL